MNKLDKNSPSNKKRMATAQQPISKTEEKVLFYLASTGASNKEIGEHFGVAEATIKRQFVALMDKTRCRSRVELAIKVWRKRYEQLEASISAHKNS